MHADLQITCLLPIWVFFFFWNVNNKSVRKVPKYSQIILKISPTPICYNRDFPWNETPRAWFLCHSFHVKKWSEPVLSISTFIDLQGQEPMKSRCPFSTSSPKNITFQILGIFNFTSCDEDLPCGGPILWPLRDCSHIPSRHLLPRVYNISIHPWVALYPATPRSLNC